MAKVLLIEDEAGMVLTLTDRLESEGHTVVSKDNGISGFDAAREDGFDLVILDVMLPKSSGFDVLRDLRKDGIDVPVLMLTAKNETVDKVLGLKLGADDYLTKPFEMMELLARVEALLRRSATISSNGSSKGSFSFEDVRCRFCQSGGAPKRRSD